MAARSFDRVAAQYSSRSRSNRSWCLRKFAIRACISVRKSLAKRGGGTGRGRGGSGGAGIVVGGSASTANVTAWMVTISVVTSKAVGEGSGGWNSSFLPVTD